MGRDLTSASRDSSLLGLFSFDTSAIINGRRDLFIPTTFKAIWDGVEQMVAQGVVAAVDEVKLELSRREDEAFAWARSVPNLFVPLEEDIQLATLEVLAAHPRLLGTGGGTRNSADPFVIALAVARGGTVVTQEQPRHIKKPRIPDVCEDLGVPWMTLPQFVDAQGWTLTLR